MRERGAVMVPAGGVNSHILTESSKSPASIAKRNKQRIANIRLTCKKQVAVIKLEKILRRGAEVFLQEELEAGLII